MKRHTPKPSSVGFDYCEDCFAKQQKIDRLEERIKQLEAQLRYRDKKDKGPFFGSSTPSSKIPVKATSPEENRMKKGGAKIGHVGNGRKSVTEAMADQIIYQTVDIDKCPDCGEPLVYKETTLRSIVDSILNKAKNILIKNEVKRCPKCKKLVVTKYPVLPKNMYGNILISSSAIMHYLHGIPLKRIEEMWGDKVVEGSLIKSFHRVADIWKPAIEKLKEEYRLKPVKHADETGWRTDGASGYSWLFCADDISIFSFKNTRSSRVAADVLGQEKIPGVLVVDRYAGYNKSPCALQYCLAHLLRNLEDIGKEFPAVKEVQSFVSCLAPLLAGAMHLRGKPISDAKYYQSAQKLKDEIEKIIRAPAAHNSIKSYQDIFKDNAHRLYHWVTDRNIPADNNRAERELRPTVIARKVSFGSQSEQGALTRSILMTVIHTAAKRLKDQTPEEWFKQTLDAFSRDMTIDPSTLLPTSNT